MLMPATRANTWLTTKPHARAKWTRQRTLPRRHTAAKEKSLTGKNSRFLDSAAVQSPRYLAHASGCLPPLVPLPEQQRKTTKSPLTHRSAFIHDVSYPLPASKTPLFRRSPALHGNQALVGCCAAPRRLPERASGGHSVSSAKKAWTARPAVMRDINSHHLLPRTAATTPHPTADRWSRM